MDNSKSSLLKNKIVIVTGGAGLLGSCFAEKIVKNGGISVIADINLEKAIQVASVINVNYPGKAYPIKLDITSEKSIDKAINDIEIFKKSAVSLATMIVLSLLASLSSIR